MLIKMTSLVCDSSRVFVQTCFCDTMILDTIPLVNRPGVTKLFELATVLAPVCHIFQMGWWYPWSGNADQPDAVRPCHWCWDSHWTYPGGQHFRSKWEL